MDFRKQMLAEIQCSVYSCTVNLIFTDLFVMAHDIMTSYAINVGTLLGINRGKSKLKIGAKISIIDGFSLKIMRSDNHPLRLVNCFTKNKWLSKTRLSEPPH